MIITNKLNKGAGFVPLLSQHFKEELNFKYNKPKLIDYIKYNIGFTYPVNKVCSKKTLHIGLTGFDNYTDEDVLFLYKVSDIFKLKDYNIKKDVLILCNLVTHHEEVKKLGYNCELIAKDNLYRLPILILENNQVLDGSWFRGSDTDKVNLTKSRYIVNPCLNRNTIDELRSAKYFIKNKIDGYNWDNNNYSDEYCEIFHLANIFGAKVRTSITNAELDYWKRNCI
jgi:hypothetical protein